MTLRCPPGGALGRAVAPVALALALLALAAAAIGGCSRDRDAQTPRGDEPAPLPPAGGAAESGVEGDGARGGELEGATALAPEREEPAVVFEPEGAQPARATVEIADTPAAIERGLMFRDHLPPDHGMLFIFPKEAIHTFWMKNTLIPLDMIFITEGRVVAGVVEEAEPRSTTPRRIDEPSKYVVEVNAGWADDHDVEAGTPVRFEGIDEQ